MKILRKFTVCLVCSLLFCGPLLFCGCDEEAATPVPLPTKQQARDFSEQVNKTFADVLANATAGINSLSPHAEELSDAAVQEVRKLSIIEYKVVDFPIDISRSAIETQLAQLGGERWECLSVVPSNSGFRVFCHRRPESYLRYVPRWVP